MSESEITVPEPEEEQNEAPSEPQAAPAAAGRPHLIRVAGRDALLGPFPSRDAADIYLRHKRTGPDPERWAESRVAVLTVDEAQAEREEARARELTGR